MVPLDATLCASNPLLLVLNKIVVAISIYLKAVITKVFLVIEVKTILAKGYLIILCKANTLQFNYLALSGAKSITTLIRPLTQCLLSSNSFFLFRICCNPTLALNIV